MEEIKLTIHPFEMGTEKEAANKVQEEANEAVHAWRSLVDVLYPITTAQKPNACMLKRTCTRLADEIADTIQASCNLAARYGIDMQAAMERCERRNRERGRYEDEDAKPCGIYDGDNRSCGGDCGAVPVGMDVLREKTPEEMSAAELYEMLRLLVSEDKWIKNFCFTDGWCFKFHRCNDCVLEILDLLKVAYEHEVADKDREIEHVKKRCAILSESYDKTMVERPQLDNTIDLIRDARDEYMRLRTENGIMLDEILIRQNRLDNLERQVADLAHECDGLRNRLAELNEAGITRLHRLLRETLGEAKNVTHNARVYIDKQHGSNNERCGDCGNIGRNHGGDCGVERAKEHVLSAESPAREMSEREAVIERLRELDFAKENLYLNDIGCAVLGRDPASWWSDESRAELRDKLIELIGEGGAE